MKYIISKMTPTFQILDNKESIQDVLRTVKAEMNNITGALAHMEKLTLSWTLICIKQLKEQRL